jgi:nucleoside-diphosphate-sugar epimerase
MRVLDNFVVGRHANLAQHEGNPNLEIITADVADRAKVDAANEGIARVFHLAARADIVLSPVLPGLYARAGARPCCLQELA